MKIVLVDVNYESSSTGKIVANLLGGMSLRLHDTYAFYGRGPAVAGVPRANRISPPIEVVLHAAATRLTGFVDGFSPVATRRLISELDRLAPDVVHLHDVHGYFLDIHKLCSYLKHVNIATVWTFHCEFMYTGRCGHAYECDGWRNGCSNCPDLRRYPASWFFDRAGEMFQQKKDMFSDFNRLQLVAPSQWLAQRMRESMVGDKPIEVIPNGIDTSTFRPLDVTDLKEQLGLRAKYCVVSIGAGLMTDRKGGHWILKLAERCQDPDIVFLMVGVEHYHGDAPSNVIMHPPVTDQSELARFYSLGNLFLLTSEKETFSMVTAEALACGLPVIGFDSGAPTEVAPAGFGRFVPYGDLDALEALLIDVRATGGGLHEPAECTEFAQKNYSSDSMVDAYDRIYQRMINQYPRNT